MSWASQRRAAYSLGVFLFFLLIIATPLAYWYFSSPATCTDGKRNQGETAVDRGGPCPLVDRGALSPLGLLWSRSFRVRDGSYNALAYLQNPNANVGVRSVRYRFGLYDERNILVTERSGTTYIMPGTVTAIFEGGIETGARVVAHTYFEFLEELSWERLVDTSGSIEISGTALSDTDTVPRLTAVVENSSVREARDIEFVAIVSDPAGNAFAVSQTALSSLAPGQSEEITFTWPAAFRVTVGKVQVVPLSPPSPL